MDAKPVENGEVAEILPVSANLSIIGEFKQMILKSHKILLNVLSSKTFSMFLIS
jgi:hypothetical protein